MRVQRDRNLPDDAERRRQAVIAGHRGDETGARALLADPEPTVRASALAALGRMHRLTDADLQVGLADPMPAVRRRAAELAPAGLATGGEADGATLMAPSTAGLSAAAAGEALLAALADADATVAEVVAWAIGELDSPPTGAVAALAAMTTGHDDALCREAAVAALGAIGDPAGLEAILAAGKDKPAVRRRAVLSLAPFEGPMVEAALQAALTDRDWQVRQAAEDLLAAEDDDSGH